MRALALVLLACAGCVWPAPTEVATPTCDDPQPYTGTVTLRPGEVVCVVVTIPGGATP